MSDENKGDQTFAMMNTLIKIHLLSLEKITIME